MTVIEFPLPFPHPHPLYNVDRSHIANFLFRPVNIVWCEMGRDMLRNGLSYTYSIVWKTQSEISTYCEENKVLNGQNVLNNFFIDCSFMNLILNVQYCDRQPNFNKI